MEVENQLGRPRRWLVIGAALLGCGCERSPKADGLASGSGLPMARSSSTPVVAAQQAPSGSTGALAPPDSRRTASGAAPAARGSASSAAALGPPSEGELRLGPAVAVPFGAVGSKGPAAAVALGATAAVGLTQSDELVAARFKDGSLLGAAEPQALFAAVAPVLTGSSPENAYWLSKGRLVRRQLSADGAVGALEELAADGSSGGPVAALTTAGPGARDVVLYAGAPEGSEGSRPPRLWVEGQGSRRLSQEASSATSVALVHAGADGFLAVSLDGRLGNSSVHAVRVAVDAAGKITLGEDRVVYVGGSAEPDTPLAGLGAGQGPVVFLPMPKDPTGFGLLSLLIRDGASEAATAWVDYPNGLDPAPVAAALICDRPRVAFVRPERAEPGSPQRLELGEVTSNGQVTAVRTVATAKRIVHVALAGAGPGRGWIAYATDAGLSAQPLACAQPSR